ncbi:MAG: hypothetical protein IT373_18180 [Polyangiaceae bacterium]|nr:hypothetical protein [Polyangiaceae bacterium]
MRLGRWHAGSALAGRPARALALGAVAAGAAACTAPAERPSDAGFRVEVTRVNGASPPTAAAPLPANLGKSTELWEFTAEAYDATGALDPTFEGYARVGVEPGSVLRVSGPDGVKRNVHFVGGVAHGVAEVTTVFGPARLWLDDQGYVPVPPGFQPFCSDGLDNDGDVLVDFPTDPGCAFPDDDSEETGSGRVGVSLPVAYELPTLADIQGRGSGTPYPSMSVSAKLCDLPDCSDARHDQAQFDALRVVVTRVTSTGFFASDTAETAGYGHLFAFNFNAPYNMRVCDRLTLVSGTASEFYGMTELSFPSFELVYPKCSTLPCADCMVPDPVVIDTAEIGSDVTMEQLESGLVRVEGFAIAQNFGSKVAVNNVFAADQSNCDLNGDGVVDFENDAEGSCGNACSASPDCSEWNGYVAQGNFKARKGGTLILLNVDSAAGFDPLAHKGQVLTSVTGTLRNFSGGSLNWTVEARCNDDLVCSSPGCSSAVKAANEACINIRPELDNDEGTN